MPTVGELTSILSQWYPPNSAESWDRVGLTVGDPAELVTKVWCTVDVTAEVIAEAKAAGAQLLVSHHPLLLRGIHGVTTTDPKGRLVTELIRSRIALWTAHTNADIAHQGVATSLADALGLVSQRPLVERELTPLANLVTFVPHEHLPTLVDALSAAGAGLVGDYERCHWATTGEGSFRPMTGADPYLGDVGEVAMITEARLEMVLPRAQSAAVVSAPRATHPYEEPAFHLVDVQTGPSDLGLGRVGRLPAPITLAKFTELLVGTIPRTVGGVRGGGDPTKEISTVAILPGAGDSLLDQARKLDVDVYVTSDLRHHPASEFLDWGGPALVDIAHWAAEWMWLPVLAAALNQAVPEVTVTVSELVTDPWTLHR